METPTTPTPAAVPAKKRTRSPRSTAQKKEKPTTGIAVVVRLRGSSGVRESINTTLAVHRLTRRYHATLIPLTIYTQGKLQQVKDYIAWGPIDASTLEKLIAKRLLVRGKPPTDAFFKELGAANAGELATSLIAGSVPLSRFQSAGAPLPFRLHPPRKGLVSQKQAHPRGSLGYWGDAINSLVKSML